MDLDQNLTPQIAPGRPFAPWVVVVCSCKDIFGKVTQIYWPPKRSGVPKYEE